MTVGMVLDRSFRLYTQNFPLMFGITAALNLPILLVSVLPPILVSQAARNTAVPLLTGLASAIILLLTTLIVYPLVTGAITKAVSDTYLGKPVTTGGALREAWGCVGTLLLTQWVAGIIVFLGLLLLVVPGILWMLSYALIAPVVIIEASDLRRPRIHTLTSDARTGPVITDRTDIRRRSWDLVKGNRGKVFMVFAIMFVLNILLSSGGAWAASLVFDAASTFGGTIQAVIRNVVSMFVSPLQTIAITLLYYDLRIRKEGFDLEMLSHAMGSPSVNA
jgi:hypothetical protein